MGTCAHVTMLRRLAVDPFELGSAMYSLAAMEAMTLGAPRGAAPRATPR